MLNTIIEQSFGEFKISNDKRLLNPELIHHFLKESYWAKDMPFEILQTAIENSFCIGIYHKAEQIGFGRLITDFATYGYLADVFVLEPFQGKGLSKKFMNYVMGLDFVKLFRRFSLGTKDAHGLYAQYGFTSLRSPDRMMEIHQPDIYQQLKKKL